MVKLLWTLKSGEAVTLHMNKTAWNEFRHLSDAEQDAYVESAPRLTGAIG